MLTKIEDEPSDGLLGEAADAVQATESIKKLLEDNVKLDEGEDVESEEGDADGDVEDEEDEADDEKGDEEAELAQTEETENSNQVEPAARHDDGNDDNGSNDEEDDSNDGGDDYEEEEDNSGAIPKTSEAEVQGGELPVSNSEEEVEDLQIAWELLEVRSNLLILCSATTF